MRDLLSDAWVVIGLAFIVYLTLAVLVGAAWERLKGRKKHDKPQ
jgi:hypothetical protein